jgi:hypothetical protein
MALDPHEDDPQLPLSDSTIRHLAQKFAPVHHVSSSSGPPTLPPSAQAPKAALTPVDAFLNERTHSHGEFSVTAELAQCLKTLMYGSTNWEHLTSVQREALEQIATKLARILSGNPAHRDAYEDVIGYCTLVIRSII